MAVTIKGTANSALSTDLLISGTLTISGAASDGTETVNASLYNESTGAIFTTMAQRYDNTQTVTYSYANGSSMSINFATGVWVYQRLSSEIGAEAFNLVVTFTWTDGLGSQSAAVTVEVKENVTVNKFEANTLDDIDTAITGTYDVSIVKPAGVQASAIVKANDDTFTGLTKTLSTGNDVLEWTFLDETKLTVDLGNKKFTYTRKSSEVNDKKTDAYNITLSLGGTNMQLGVLSVVRFPPSINVFTANKTLDTASSITGVFRASNTDDCTIKVAMTHNGMYFTGNTVDFASNMSWTFTDGTKFELDALNKSWTYTRAVEDTTDLQSDNYVFDLSIASKYGSDTASLTVDTTIPKAEISSFMADNIGDDENYITGSLAYTLPSIAKNPTLKIDVTVNGIAYVAEAVPITNKSLIFEYGNGARLVTNPSNQTFTYTRAVDDVGNSEADTYIFGLQIIVNGETVTQNLNVKSMAGQRVYDYEPAYPVNVAAGSLERQNTAWPKYTMEIQRIYRQFNDNLNYYENLAVDLRKQVTDLLDSINSRFEEYDKKISEALSKLSTIGIKAITGVAYHGSTIPVPEGSNRANCVCLVSLHHWTRTQSDNKYTYDMYIWVDDNWVLTCYTVTSGRDGSGGTYPGYANYLVIDTSTLG